MDAYNRYEIYLHVGATESVYGVLDKANIAGEFQDLLNIINPPPSFPKMEEGIRPMFPLLQLVPAPGEKTWMVRRGESLYETMDSGAKVDEGFVHGEAEMQSDG